MIIVNLSFGVIKLIKIFNAKLFLQKENQIFLNGFCKKEKYEGF